MRARIAVLLSSLLFGACGGGKDPLSSAPDAAEKTISNRVAATCEKCGRAQGRLVIEPVVASLRPPLRLVAPGTDVVTLMFQESAFAEQALVTRYIVTHSIHGVSDERTARSSFVRHELWCENEKLVTLGPGVVLPFTGPVLEEYLDFNLGTAGAYRIPDREKRTCAVRSRVNEWPYIESGTVHGFWLRLDPLGNSTAAITARGESSGARLGGPDQEVYGDQVVVRRAYPIVRFLRLPSSALAGGATSQQTLASFSMEAVGGQTRHKKITFRVRLYDETRVQDDPNTRLSLSNFKLYRNNRLMWPIEYVIFTSGGTSQEHQLSDSGTAVLSQEGSTTVVVVFQNQDGWRAGGEEVIDWGTTNTYALKVDIANAHVGSPSDSDFISVTMLGDEGGDVPTSLLESHPTGVVTVGSNGRNANFVWSDYSAELGLHDSSVPSPVSYDWTNGFLVPTSADQRNHLPLDLWVLSK